MPLERMKQIVREDFDAQIGIWGSVERAPGARGEVYDLVIKCVDFSAPGGPKTIYDRSVRTNSVSEIPHLYVKEMLDALYSAQARRPAGRRPRDRGKLEEKPEPRRRRRFPVGLRRRAARAGSRSAGSTASRWAASSAGSPRPASRRTSVIRFTFDEDVGNNEGVMYYSKPFPVEEGSTYRFQCRWRSNGPTAKVFIKCYDEFASAYRPQSGVPSSTQLREVYRSQQNLKGPINVWNTQTEDFTPAHTKYTPRWGRVMLYAYIGGGRRRVRRRRGEADRSGFGHHQRQQEAPPVAGNKDHGRGNGGERTPQQGIAVVPSPSGRGLG